MVKRFFAFILAMLAASAVTAQADYRLNAGDQLSIEVLEDATLNRSVLVLPTGTFTFPLVGSVTAAGRTAQQVEQALSAGLAPNFATAPTVFVSVAGLGAQVATASTIDVYLVGEIANPGKMQVEPGTTLLQMIAESGGPTRFAATKRIQLRRIDRKSKQERVYVFNYNAVQAGKTISGRTVLADGDVIVVPERRLFE